MLRTCLTIFKPFSTANSLQNAVKEYPPLDRMEKAGSGKRTGKKTGAKTRHGRNCAVTRHIDINYKFDRLLYDLLCINAPQNGGKSWEWQESWQEDWSGNKARTYSLPETMGDASSVTSEGCLNLIKS